MSRMENPILIAALGYAKRGWRVFPILALTSDGCECGRSDCDRPGKHPAIKGWNTKATTDAKQIAAWWIEHPNRGVGIATGEASGLSVLDVDGDNGEGAHELGMRAGAEGVPPTPTVQSRVGRYHYYFAYSAEIKSNAKKIGEDLDTRSDGGYVVAPPSPHASGSYYNWLVSPEKVSLAPWPEWLKEGGAKKVEKKRGRPAKEDFDPNDPMQVERLTAALAHCDFDDEEQWGQAGWIFGRAFQQSDVGFAIYSAWAGRSRQFDRRKTRQHYYERSKAPYSGEFKTTASIYAWARERGWDDPEAKRDGDHYRLALATVEAIQKESGARPVYALGALWIVRDELWCAKSVDRLAIEIAERFAGGKYCRRGSDFSSVAKLVCGVVEDETFFADAAVGVAAPGGFWRITDNGKIDCEPLSAAHRQRMRVSADPDRRAQPKLLLKLLNDAFRNHEPEAQARLMQQLCGCAITRSLWRHMLATLLLGATKSGKSTLLKLLTSVFPRDQVGATSPQRWGDEYYVAALAGMALNVVGELDKKDPIPGGAFKNTVGRDIIQGRHPTHRPFTFVCQAAHFFNANHTPPTTDHSDAFFNRWRVVHFANSVPPDERILDLDQRLIAEETGAFLWWALEGAAEVARVGGVLDTNTSKDLLGKWRRENNSALAFLYDITQCRFESGGSVSGQELYTRYKGWAADAGLRCFGRNGFYDALEAGAGEVGIQVVTIQNQVHVKGVRLVTPDRD